MSSHFVLVEDKIILDINLLLDAEYVNEIFHTTGYSLTDLKRRLIDMVHQHFQAKQNDGL